MRESWISARAISTRRFMPDDKVRTSFSRHSVNSTSLEQRLDPLPPQPAGNAVDQTVKVQVFVHRQAVVEARILEDHADRAAGARGLRDDVEFADVRTVPLSGCSTVHRMCSNVVFAGAVGTQQREQLIRRWTSMLMSLSATVRP